MPPSMNKLERATQDLPKARSIISHHGQAAAFFGSIEREGGDDGVPSDLQGSLKALDISGTFMVLGEEVERGPIMPDVVCLVRLPDGDVRDDPVNPCGKSAEARLGSLQCSL